MLNIFQVKTALNTVFQPIKVILLTKKHKPAIIFGYKSNNFFIFFFIFF